MANKKTTAEVAENVEATAPVDDGYETVKLFRDNGRYKDPKPVICNGVAITVPRGKAVRIKHKYAEILRNSAIQDGVAADLIEEKKNDFESARDRLDG